LKRSAKGYTIAELIVVVIFVGILSAIAIPRINFAIVRKSKADATSELIVAGLRRTRRIAISNATEDNNYRFVMQGGGPYSGFKIKENGTDLDEITFDSDVSVTNDHTFRFGPLGNLLNGSTQIDVAAEGRSFTITVVPATGMIKCVKN